MPAIDRALSPKACAKRRAQLMQMVGEDAILILPAAPERIRSRDTHYPYRQDSDFWYLTAFNEPQDLVATHVGLDEVRMGGEVVQERLLIPGEAEEVVVFLQPLRLGLRMERTAAVDEVFLLFEGLAADAIPTFVRALVDVAIGAYHQLFDGEERYAGSIARTVVFYYFFVTFAIGKAEVGRQIIVEFVLCRNSQIDARCHFVKVLERFQYIAVFPEVFLMAEL